jgi:hypothetical protein
MFVIESAAAVFRNAATMVPYFVLSSKAETLKR